jgi:tetratricopeptide (TPR) repeat protein
LLRKLAILDLERLAAALSAGMRAETLAARDYDEALRLFQQALELNPYCDMAVMGCGVCLFEQGKTAEALEWMERAVRLNPHNEKARRNLSAIKSQMIRRQ